jgi:hypothetical protein
MLNENQKLAPDREQMNFGYDNNYEYRLYGRFSGDKVYEPASNGVYPEFVLKGYELISTTQRRSSKANTAARVTTDTRSKNPSSRKESRSGPGDRLVEEFLGFLEVERNASPRTLRIYEAALRDFQAQSGAPGGGSARRNIFAIIFSI